MLTIRMQRTGRKGHAMFRVVVQDSRVTPTSGKVVAYLGSYDPHSKAVTLDKEKAAQFLTNGAQPSDRAARLMEAEGVVLPKWYTKPAQKKSELRNPEKLRRNQPKVEAPVEEAKPAVEEPTTEVESAEVVSEEPATEAVA